MAALDENLGQAGRKLLQATLGNPLGLGDTLLESHSVEVGLAWDYYDGQPKVDLDCAAVVIDQSGVVRDACYYNCLSCSGGSESNPTALSHSGDNRDGVGEGFDETLKIDLPSLPQHVVVVALIVTAASGGTFCDVESAHVRVSAVDATASSTAAGESSECLTDYSIAGVPGSQHTSVILSIIFRDQASGTWTYRRIEAKSFGANFLEAMPALEPVVDSVLPPGTRAMHTLQASKTFAMHKGEIFSIPKDLFIGGEDLFVGLGWDTIGHSVDLDASVVALGAGGVVGGFAWFGHLKGGIPGVEHQGDNTTGAGSGDDENVLFDLDEVPFGVKELVVVVNIYSNHTFRDVRNAYIRLVGVANKKELLRYTLEPGTCTDRGLVFAKLFRTADHGWGVEALGRNCGGNRVLTVPTLAAAGAKQQQNSRDRGRGFRKDGGASKLVVHARGRGLPNKDGWLSRSDPYLVFKRLVDPTPAELFAGSDVASGGGISDAFVGPFTPATDAAPGGFLGPPKHIQGSSTFQEMFRSSVVNNNLNPDWPTFEIIPLQVLEPHLKTPVRIEVWDWDSPTKSDYMGEVDVPGGLAELIVRSASSGSLTLQCIKGANRGKNPGKLRGTLQLQLELQPSTDEFLTPTAKEFVTGF